MQQTSDRERRAAAGIVSVLTATFACLVYAQPVTTTGEPTVVGVHYQDLLPSDGDTVEVFLPRPQLASWDGVTLSSSDDCAELGDLRDPGPDHVLVLEVTLRGAHGALEPGQTCAATITASHRSGATSWDGATLLLVNRLAHPPAPPDMLDVTLTVDRIPLPIAAGARTVGSLVTLALSNRAAEPVTLLGLADQHGFSDLVGTVYQHDAGLDVTIARLEESGRDLAPTTLAPGESTYVALLLDPRSRLPDGSAVITIQPALLVSVAGTHYSIRFERLSVAWGNELP